MCLAVAVVRKVLDDQDGRQNQDGDRDHPAPPAPGFAVAALAEDVTHWPPPKQADLRTRGHQPACARAPPQPGRDRTPSAATTWTSRCTTLRTPIPSLFSGSDSAGAVPLFYRERRRVSATAGARTGRTEIIPQQAAVRWQIRGKNGHQHDSDRKRDERRSQPVRPRGRRLPGLLGGAQLRAPRRGDGPVPAAPGPPVRARRGRGGRIRPAFRRSPAVRRPGDPGRPELPAAGSGRTLPGPGSGDRDAAHRRGSPGLRRGQRRPGRHGPRPASSARPGAGTFRDRPDSQARRIRHRRGRQRQARGQPAPLLAQRPEDPHGAG